MKLIKLINQIGILDPIKCVTPGWNSGQCPPLDHEGRTLGTLSQLLCRQTNLHIHNRDIHDVPEGITGAFSDLITP